ncbi:AIPR family protein [Leptospira sp. 'Mane']|uniref:AIPR family protein n=1 Tax=Leptospira sp. 'Mane' TaxID=3387407 RepID=UPI00398B4617
MDFYSRIEEQVKELTGKFYYQNTGTAFGHLVIKEAFSKIIDFNYGSLDFDTFIKSHIVDKANDLGNDFIFVDREINEIHLFQFKYSKNNLISLEEIRKNKVFIEWLFGLNNHILSPNLDLKQIIEEEINEVITDENKKEGNYHILFYYINSYYSPKDKANIAGLFSNFRDLGINFSVKCYDYTDIENLYDDVEIPRNEIQLEIVEGEFFLKDYSYFEETNDLTKLTTIVTSIKASSLKSIFDEIKELLFSLNVRYYKGENDINLKIKNEFSRGTKSNFWILNNGINAICQNFEINNSNLIIKNFQIVNGGQTTKTLARLVNAIPDSVHILMRLTKIPDISKTSKIAKKIAITSNSQNAITPRDLHSGDRIQEVIFNKLSNVGIFYDKKDGEWSVVADKSKYKDPNGIRNSYKKISNIDLAKSYMSFFLQIPISTKGRDKLVFSDLYYNEIFGRKQNEEEQFRKLMFSYRLSERILLIIKKKEKLYEILQNNHFAEVIVSLSSLYYFKENLLEIKTLEDIRTRLLSIEAINFIDQDRQYQLKDDLKFEDFIVLIIKGLQEFLKILKKAKEMNGSHWIHKDTSNWLKKDGTYKEIVAEVSSYLCQNS